MLKKVKKRYDFIIDSLAVVLLVVLTYVSFHQIFTRVVFSSPPAWTEELTRYIFIWVTFLGAAIAFRLAAHLGVDYFVNLLPDILRKIVSICVYILLIVILAVITAKGIEVVQMVKNQLSPVLRISMSLPYLAIPLGTGLCLLEVLWTMLFGRRKEEVVEVWE